MIIRKLSSEAVRQLCACGLFPHEYGHHTACAVWQAQEVRRLRDRIARIEAQIAAMRPSLSSRCPDRLPTNPEFWRCVDCRSAVFARSARDADRCVRCAAKSARRTT